MKKLLYKFMLFFYLLPVLAFGNNMMGEEQVLNSHMNADCMGNMMFGGFGLLWFLTWIVWLVVGVLAAVWLWRQINKK